MKMQLLPHNNFSIAKNRPAYSDQRQGINADQYERLRNNLSLDPTGLNLPNLETRVDFYIGKLNSFLGKVGWFSAAKENLSEEWGLIKKEKEESINFLRGKELQRRLEDFSGLQSELSFKNPAEKKKHIVDLIRKYNQLKQRIADLMKFPPELSVD
jgi:hypothetical protein